jgi:hypothetical protein
MLLNTMVSNTSGAYAVVHGAEPQVFLAENEHVMSRLLALEVVAKSSPSQFKSRSRVEAVRSALLEERWADAMLLWMTSTGLAVDVYPESLKCWSEANLDEEQASMEIRMAPIFND